MCFQVRNYSQYLSLGNLGHPPAPGPVTSSVGQITTEAGYRLRRNVTVHE